MTDTRIFYFGLEPLIERYTFQLSVEWMPDTFKNSKFVAINGDSVPGEIKVGSVLDSIGRGTYALSQCQKFLSLIGNGTVKDGDVILLQDFWTPGIEAIFYALDLHKINVRLYSMLHAQSVDEYDFTYPMRSWMRPFELGIDKRHTGIFVGSTIHREQLRAAGFQAPIHVVSLPIHKKMAMDVLPNPGKKSNKVVFTSRLDSEKNPRFMLSVAQEFLNTHLDWVWVVTTSGRKFKSSLPGFMKELSDFSRRHARFILKTGLTKNEYYDELATAKIQFNSSLQDYVSWTLIESTMFGCDIAYPNFRSFPEIIHPDRLYRPFFVDSAIEVMNRCISNPREHQYISDLSDKGRRMEADIINNNIVNEFNIWHQHENLYGGQ
jgi:glycosyltransferase involved in cell wall biosynthesis